MRLSFGVSISLLLAASSAIAADLPAPKADYFVEPPPPPAPVLPLYAGVFGGGAFGRGTTDFTGKNIFCATGSPVGDAAFCNAANGGVAGASSLSGNGSSLFGGLRIGADFAVSQSVILGAVADFSLLRLRHSSSREYSNFSQPATYGEDVGLLQSSLNTNWLATLRGKLGVLASERILLFATGGLALVDVDASVRNEYDVVDATNPARPSLLPLGPVVQRGSISDVAFGYAVGGGLQYALTRNIGLSLEYLYYSASKSYTVTQVSGTPLDPSSFRAKARPSGHLTSIGIDYKL